MFNKKFKEIKAWFEEHDTEVFYGTTFAGIAIFLILYSYASFDQGVNAAIKAYRKATVLGMTDLVEKGELVLMMPTESGKLVKTMDLAAWAEAVTAVIEAA